MNDAPMIEVSGLFKIFGAHPESALPVVDKGFGKDEIFDRTGQTVGVHDAELSIREGEVFVVTGIPATGRIGSGR